MSSQRSEWSYDWKLNKENVQIGSHSIGERFIIFWTENFEYLLIEESGQEVCKGQLEGFKNQEKVPHAVSNNCCWFSPMGDATKLACVKYKGNIKADIVEVDLMTAKVVKVLVKDIEILGGNIGVF